jgi:transposase-like protein
MGRRLSLEQIVRKLRQAEARLAAGATVLEAARKLSLSEATLHRWKNHYGVMSTSEASQGAGVREWPPQEASRREGAGHRQPKGGEPGKLLSPTRRRATVKHVRQRLGVSERRACGVISQPRLS